MQKYVYFRVVCLWGEERAEISLSHAPHRSIFSNSVCISSLVVVRALQRFVDHQFACFHDLAAHDHLIQDLVHLVKVEHQVQFAHAPEVLV